MCMENIFSDTWDFLIKWDWIRGRYFTNKITPKVIDKNGDLTGNDHHTRGGFWGTIPE